MQHFSGYVCDAIKLVKLVSKTPLDNNSLNTKVGVKSNYDRIRNRIQLNSLFKIVSFFSQVVLKSKYMPNDKLPINL